MPGFDGTGPEGLGPMTGKAMRRGRCRGRRKRSRECNIDVEVTCPLAGTKKCPVVMEKLEDLEKNKKENNG